jgi:hypothetical protein
VEEAAKPKEKTIFNVKLESFDAGAKPKIIKEVKAIVPNLTLIEVRVLLRPFSLPGVNILSLIIFWFVFRPKSLSSLSRGCSRRVSPRRMQRRSKRRLRRTELWSSSTRRACLLPKRYSYLDPIVHTQAHTPTPRHAQNYAINHRVAAPHTRGQIIDLRTYKKRVEGK